MPRLALAANDTKRFSVWLDELRDKGGSTAETVEADRIAGEAFWLGRQIALRA